ncbi:IS66 family insertion sequence element accessory protein TnpA [Marinagarivorans cellulosilyticus]|uniref:Transposase n=1 Tax=Marinagarivorans cellulosilyticus TaxID=2721545 RepID=A0AAN1WLR2_9GAMM|nr:IS66 family insertion sequence element accessory protein TnpB [Marinagarivorans cellulosilyticus]BCD99863.1 hypothetical protein MARGE09_P4065 [Marinagarivorans cellulosilyticus]
MKRRTKAQWQALIEEQAQSGLTAVKFCKQHGINDKYFSLRKQALLKETPKGSGFAVARVSSSTSTIEVTAGNTIISLPASQPAAWVADFVKALA